jgi:hypothetical protein
VYVCVCVCVCVRIPRRDGQEQCKQLEACAAPELRHISVSILTKRPTKETYYISKDTYYISTETYEQCTHFVAYAAAELGHE